MKNKIISMIFYLFRVFPINNNKIVIASFGGKGYGSEGKAIADRLMEARNDLDIVWLVRNPDEKLPKDIRGIKFASIKAIYEQVTAKVWIDNRRKPGYVRKRRGQYYIHTWHGGGPCLKWVEKDASDTLPREYIEYAINDSKMANLMVSGSDWRTKNMRDSFWYDGEIAKCDLFKKIKSESESDIKSKVYNFFDELDDNDHFLLYAPTFRADKNLECYNMNFSKVIDTLSNVYGGTWKVIVRLHPSIASLDGFMHYTDKVLNGSQYSQIEDLIIATDFLVTDYSGCIFDGFKLKRKVILYALDLEHYLSKERGMYFDIHSLPAPLCQNMNEFLECLKKFDEAKYEKDRSAFVDEIGYYDDVGPEVVVNKILVEIKR